MPPRANFDYLEHLEVLKDLEDLEVLGCLEAMVVLEDLDIASAHDKYYYGHRVKRA